MVDSVMAQGIISVIALVIMVVGMAGIVLPVLPGSLVIILTLLAWAISVGGTPVWVTAIIAMVFAILGWSASTVLTGRAVHREGIPRKPLFVALGCALIGLFLLPPLGLFLGFAAGLFGAEYLRRDRDAAAAGAASLRAMRAMGLGILLELGLAGLAICTAVIGSLIHFLL
jgi:uncharacterized protein YqgC (DUF456 family)